jgi:hypothetical protein
MAPLKRARFLVGTLIVYIFCILSGPSYAGNDVLGEIELLAASKVEKTSGVWIDGQYMGYLKELKGSKKILLLPGNTRSSSGKEDTKTSPKKSWFNLG